MKLVFLFSLFFSYPSCNSPEVNEETKKNPEDEDSFNTHLDYSTTGSTLKAESDFRIEILKNFLDTMTSLGVVDRIHLRLRPQASGTNHID